MKQLPLVQIGNPQLRDVCKEYKSDTITSKDARDFVKQLKYTLKKISGVGLAAPQVGVAKRMFIITLMPTKYRPNVAIVKPYAVFNPAIITVSKEQSTDWEGCFSVANAGLFGQVKRPERITVKYLDEQANEITKDLSGLEARVFLHEYDHLDGYVFMDKNPDIASLMSASEYKRMRSESMLKA